MRSYPILQAHSFHEHACDEIGMPSMAYEVFYQQGLSCHRWGLPRPYVRQALKSVCESWLARFRTPVAYWQIRAFSYGLRGLDSRAPESGYLRMRLGREKAVEGGPESWRDCPAPCGCRLPQRVPVASGQNSGSSRPTRNCLPVLTDAGFQCSSWLMH